MNLRRYKALVFAIMPFFVVGILWFLMETDESWGKIGYLMLLIASVPILAAFTVASVVSAFSKKDPNRRFIRTTKVVSVVSATVFVGATLFGLIGVVTSMTGIS